MNRRPSKPKMEFLWQDLTEDDWKFSWCRSEDNKLISCLFHESMREFVRLGEPYPPWISNPEDYRESAVKSMTSLDHKQMLENVRYAFFTRPDREDVKVRASFSIDWHLNDAQLVDLFKRWLKENRPKDRPSVRKGVGAGGPFRRAKRKLQALSAYRLWHHFQGDWKAANKHSEKYFYTRGNRERFWGESVEEVVTHLGSYLEESNQAD